MHHLVYIRNLCAHHSRLWDRIWTIKPTLPAAFAWKPPKLPGNNRLFVTLLVLSYLLKSCSSMAAFRASWRQRVEMHLRSPPSAPNAMEKMGLTVGWFGHPFWL
jgi:abortive infection bacteriophage resistance protein